MPNAAAQQITEPQGSTPPPPPLLRDPVNHRLVTLYPG